MKMPRVASNPDRRLSESPILTEGERHQLLVEWNDTKREYPRDKCSHQLFEEQVERTPHAVAAVYEGQELAYGELNRRANQLAHYLRKVGVGPEVLVGICVERSLEMVVGLLGILKAGGAYVPLDPAYPKERLAFMLNDTQAPVLVTQWRLLADLPHCHARVVCLDEDWLAISTESDDDLPNQTTPDNLAYVIYTSGSTGAPKGVEIPHRGVVRLLFGTEYVRFGVGQDFLQLAPVSFDASTLEVWGPLLHGARCILFPGTTPSPGELERILRDKRVRCLWLTASLFNFVVDEKPEALSSVASLLTGGEALSVRHVRRALDRLPSVEIINGYGPTESTTFACCYRIPRQWDRTPASIPIGRPIANTQVYILDRWLKPVPVGVPGELHLGGDGLARGYLNRPELTAEKFIANPFSPEPGARLYKTGDLARYLPDGNIEFLGRLDHQVKIRGFRVELGETEAVLGQHPLVQQAVVVAQEDTSGSRRLVAYVVPAAGNAPTVERLRNHLQGRLPEYMVPSAFVFLEALPLTPNGKVDRQALPPPDQTRPVLREVFVAPRTPTEEVMAGIWAAVLEVDQVGVHDNFFELGGHSLLASKVISRVREALGVDVPLRSLFESPTVAGLATSLLRQLGDRLRVERKAELLLRVAQLSDDEVQAMVEKRAESAKEASGR